MLSRRKRIIYISFIFITTIIIYTLLGIQKKKNQNLRKSWKMKNIDLREEELMMHNRKLYHHLLELFYSLNSNINNNIKYNQTFGNILNRQEKTQYQIIHLLSNSRQYLVKNTKKYQRELMKLSDHFQLALQRLQNPGDCLKARLLVCKSIFLYCGFTCYLHHISFWLTIAAAANRTLILENDGENWLYGNSGWNGIFIPLTKCKYKDSIHPSSPPFPQYNGPLQSARIVTIPVNDSREHYKDLPNKPLIIPQKYEKLLFLYHANPPLWFMGQFIKYIWKHSKQILQCTSKLQAQIPIGKGPILGIQIRRTDKIAEADYHLLDDYMKWTELWYEIKSTNITTKQLFIATDEPAVIAEAKSRWGLENFNGYQIYALEQSAKKAEKKNTRYEEDALCGLIAEINILSRCDFVVCTFSSNICRFVYELMQSLKGDAVYDIESLDDYYYEWYTVKKMTALDEYHKFNQNEIDSLRGDIIEINHVFWNGTVNGTNLRTQETGLFPSYLLQEQYSFGNFSIFD